MTDQAFGSQSGWGNPDLKELPIRVTRQVAAELLRQYYFTTSRRTLERAPLRWQRLNGKAHVLVAELFAWAESVLAAAPVVQSGRNVAGQEDAA